MQSAARSRERNLKHDAEMATNVEQIESSSDDDEMDAEIEFLEMKVQEAERKIAEANERANRYLREADATIQKANQRANRYLQVAAAANERANWYLQRALLAEQELEAIKLRKDSAMVPFVGHLGSVLQGGASTSSVGADATTGNLPHEGGSV